MKDEPVGRLWVISVPIRVRREGAKLLTKAEREVLDQAARGMSNTAIARLRKRSVRTVVNQLASAYRKLGVQSRSQLAAWRQSE